MIKTFCDRCEKECKQLAEIKVPTEKTLGGFSTECINVCDECKKEYDNIIDKLTDIRFVLFSDFMKGGAE